MSNTKQFITAVAILALALAVLNPLHLWMPTMLAMVILAGLFVLFCLFAAFVLLERSGDERDEQHRAFAGRAGFLVGAALLVAGIVWQDLAQALDPWLVAVLCAMILAKICARLWSSSRH